jgi:HPt (histidine-containing phosphotransfer) domain-containing protein
MSRVIGELAADVKAQLERINTALRRDDRATMADAAHRIITSACMMGADELAGAAMKLDALARGDRAKGAAAMEPPVRALLDRWSETEAALEFQARP